ncbi:MAG: gamma-glutamylcyclotransferase family protein [Hyphomicrobiaceae bacterium]
MQRVFVYGTLKRGFPNHAGVMEPFPYIGRATTLDSFPLVVGGPWFSPYLIAEPGQGHRIAGEVFDVDERGLTILDRFEGTHLPNGYRRAKISIVCEPDARPSDAWTLVKDRLTIDGIHSAPMAEYAFDPRYVHPSRRPQRS